MDKLTLEIAHRDMVAALIKPGREHLNEITPDELELWHMATGVSGEAGELLDCVKKSVIYRRPIDMTNAIEELGDIEFYLEGVRRKLCISREETLQANMAKLSLRYADYKFTNQRAQERADKAPGTPTPQTEPGAPSAPTTAQDEPIVCEYKGVKISRGHEAGIRVLHCWINGEHHGLNVDGGRAVEANAVRLLKETIDKKSKA